MSGTWAPCARRLSHGDAHARLRRQVRVEPGDATEDSGYRAAVRLLAGPAADRPTAINAYNDLTAIGVMDAALELGVRIPDDLSVTGYDNSRLAGLRHVSLTSVDPVSYDVGRRAAAALLERIGDPAREPRTVLLPPVLAVRGSTAPRSTEEPS